MMGSRQQEALRWPGSRTYPASNQRDGRRAMVRGRARPVAAARSGRAGGQEIARRAGGLVARVLLVSCVGRKKSTNPCIGCKHCRWLVTWGRVLASPASTQHLRASALPSAVGTLRSVQVCCTNQARPPTSTTGLASSASPPGLGRRRPEADRAPQARRALDGAGPRKPAGPWTAPGPASPPGPGRRPAPHWA